MGKRFAVFVSFALCLPLLPIKDVSAVVGMILVPRCVEDLPYIGGNVRIWDYKGPKIKTAFESYFIAQSEMHLMPVCIKHKRMI